MFEISKLISLFAITVSVVIVFYIYSRKNTSSEKVISQKLLIVGTLAISLTLVSLTWRHEHVAPFIQYILTSGAGVGFIFACIMIVCKNFKLAPYAITVAVVFSFIHALIAFFLF